MAKNHEPGHFGVGLRLNEAYQKTMHWFFSYPDSIIGLNDLSRKLQTSKTTAKRMVLELEKDGFLQKKAYGKSWMISCNKTHPFNLTRKVAFNLAMVSEAYQSGLRERIRHVVGNPKAVVLFGSYRKGDDTEKSDIDIAVEAQANKGLQIIHLGTIGKFGFRRDVPVSLHLFSRNRIDINLFCNIANGILLEGFLEVRP